MQEEPKLDPIAAAASGKWQFGIRHLLGLMTYVGIALGIATWQGPQTLMVTLGLGLALLSHLGAFERWQQGRTQLVLVGLAWVAYLVSLCVPCTNGFAVFGWQAVGIYLSLPVDAILHPNGTNVEPFGWPWLICVDLSNVLQAILPLHIWRLSRDRGQVLAMVSCLVMVGPWTTLALESDLFIGYYIWCASFMVMVISVPVRRGTLIGMACMAGVIVTIFRLFGPD